MRILLSLLILCVPLSAAAGEARLRALETRLDALLADMLGPGRARVFLHPETRRSRLANKPRGAVLWDRIERRIKKAPHVLPGFKVPRSLKDETLRSLKTSLGAGWRARSVLRVRVVVDSRATPAELDAIRTALNSALGLDTAAGDIVEMHPAPMRRRLPAWALYGFGAAALILLLMLASRRLDLNLPNFSWPRWAPSRIFLPSGKALPPVISALGRRHVPTIVDFLESEPPETAAEIFRSLARETIPEVFRRLSTLRRLALAEILLLTEPAPARRGGPENRLMAQVAGFEAGLGLLEHILLHCSERLREQVLEHLDRISPARARNLREELLTLEDLAAADLESLKRCLSAFSIDDLALGLYESPKDARERILSALPEIIRGMVSRRARYFVPESYEAVASMRGEIYARWKRLELYGRVRPLRLVGN